MVTATSIQWASDVQLMLRVQQGDNTAFAALWAHYEQKVMQRFHFLLGHYQDAEDLTQEVFLRIFRGRKSYQPTARFSTWLFTIVNNLARNALRSRRRAARVFCCRVRSESVPADDPRAEEPLASLLRQELRGQLLAALEQLPTRQKAALRSHALGSCSNGVIGDRLGLSIAATKSLLHRARCRVRQDLSEELAAPP